LKLKCIVSGVVGVAQVPSVLQRGLLRLTNFEIMTKVAIAAKEYLRRVQNVNETIAPQLADLDVLNQELLDRT
jgi:enolase